MACNEAVTCPAHLAAPLPHSRAKLTPVRHGQVVDNSSAFRMIEGVPLVIPEVNADALKGMTKGKGGIVANPNCSTIIALMAVTPLHRLANVKRMVVSTYQVRQNLTRATLERAAQWVWFLVCRRLCLSWHDFDLCLEVVSRMALAMAA